MKRKNVLFLSVTKYDLAKDVHLRKKFEGLSQGIRPYVLARGRTFGKKVFGAEFYLLPRNIFFWPTAFVLAFWLCLAKKIDTIVAQGPLIEGLAGTIFKKIFRIELIIELHGDWRGKKNLAKNAGFSLKNDDKIRAVAAYFAAEGRK